MIVTTAQLLDHCIKCKNKILDKYYLQTKDGIYHSNCLRCGQCDLKLDGQVNCYNRNGQIYCRTDYERLFHQSINSCFRCGISIKTGQLVQRVNSTNTLFHLECFKCSICSTTLRAGQRYTFLEPNFELFCELHFTESTHTSSSIKSKTNKDQKSAKNKRNRTSFKLNQMAEMKAFFETNKNPDSAQLARLATYTGLEPRVLRVWFQNKRAKLKNYQRRRIQKSIGPLNVPEEINLDLNLDPTKIKMLDSTDSDEEFSCFQILKRDQYSYLFQNLTNQFISSSLRN